MFDVIVKLCKWDDCFWFLFNFDILKFYIDIKWLWDIVWEVVGLFGLWIYDLWYLVVFFMINVGIDFYVVGKVLGYFDY